jgi:hypothetical protein
MRVHRIITRLAVVAGGLSLTAGVLATAAPANAVPAAPAATNFVTGGELKAVAATSGSNAWAVGAAGNIKNNGLPAKRSTLLLHWNGKSWAKSPGYTPVTGELLAISAVSATNAWVAGYTGVASSPGQPTTTKTLLLHWNGKKWLTVAAPMSGLGEFTAISMRAQSGWLLASTDTDHAWRWDGTNWHLQDLPQFFFPDALAEASPASAWAVGTDARTARGKGGVAHWNGHAWQVVQTPQSAANRELLAVAAGPGGQAWVTGGWAPKNLFQGVTTHWTGSAWLPGPVSDVGDVLASVTFIPGGTAWTAGNRIYRWTGKKWALSKALLAGFSNGVTATGTGNAWAVGFNEGQGFVEKTFILHWNGKTWR